MTFLFEFMDQRWISRSLHQTLQEVLEFHLSVTLSYYYKWAAERALARGERVGATQVIEMGAGSAGFSRALATLVRDRKKALKVEVSDLRPNCERYRELKRSFPDIVKVRTDPVDFLDWTPSSEGKPLVVLSAAFHHVPLEARTRILKTLVNHEILIFESVTRTLPSMLGCAIGFLPAMLTPLHYARLRPGRWRRFFWCWVVPVAPLMVAWDGVVSCLRCWTESEWKTELRSLGVTDAEISFEARGFSYMIGC